MQAVDYEQIPFKWKYCHKYGHFAKSCPKKPEKANPEEGWNVASKRKGARAAPTQSQNTAAKNAVENKFQVISNEEMKAVKLVEEEEVIIP